GCQSFRAEISSRSTLSRSLFASPAAQRRLHRACVGGMGLAVRQAPLAYWKKSLQGLWVRSRSPTSMPWNALVDAAATAGAAAVAAGGVGAGAGAAQQHTRRIQLTGRHA